MLCVFQLPIADGRSFTSNGSARLTRPYWQNPEIARSFVRCFGPMSRRDRWNHLDEDWIDELFYCEARRAIRFPGLERNTCGIYGCAFRRLLHDGKALTRVEIGFHVALNASLDADRAVEFIRNILELPTMVAQFPGPFVERPLHKQSTSIARLYEQATQPVDTPSIPRGLITDTTPLLLIEHEGHELKNLPDIAESLALQYAKESSLSWLTFTYGSHLLPIWFLNKEGLSAEQARQLRLALLRVNAYRQVLNHILRLIGRKVISYEPHTEAGDDLERFLNKSTRYLNAKSWTKAHQRSISTAIATLETQIAESERALLLAELQGARRQIQKKLREYVEKTERSEGKTIVVLNGNASIGEFIIEGERHMTTTNIHFGQNNTFHGDAIAAGHIENSFNTASNSVDDNVKEALEELTVEVSKLCERIPDTETQQQTARKLKTLVEEAASTAPDNSMLKVTGEGLIKAAKTVAGMAEPITKAVKVVLTLFGLAL